MSEAVGMDSALQDLRASAVQEIDYLKSIGSDVDLVMATANLGGYEAILRLIASDESGVPVYDLVSRVQTKYASQAGLISRLRAMRDRGLLEGLPGKKKSQVCLVPSQSLIDRLGPILVKRYGF